VSESTFVKIRGGSLLTDGLRGAGAGQKTADKVIFVLKPVRAKWPNPELVSRGGPLSNSFLLKVPGSLMWGKMKKSKPTPELCGGPVLVLVGDINEGWAGQRDISPCCSMSLCSHLCFLSADTSLQPRALSLCLQESRGQISKGISLSSLSPAVPTSCQPRCQRQSPHRLTD